MPFARQIGLSYRHHQPGREALVWILAMIIWVICLPGHCRDYMAIPAEQAAQADFRLPAIAVGTQLQRFSKFAEKSAAAYLTVCHIPTRIQP